MADSETRAGSDQRHEIEWALTNERQLTQSLISQRDVLRVALERIARISHRSGPAYQYAVDALSLVEEIRLNHGQRRDS